MQIDIDKFITARLMATNECREGIGRLGEKMMHRTLKHYFEPNKCFHEIPFLGSVADIKNKEGIIEIQTRSFEKLIPKLERFLEEETVTVVCPIIERKTICQIDVESGESLPPKKSSKRGKAADALSEIAKIRQFIPSERLTICLVFLDVTETRMLGAKKRVGRKQTSKIDSIPTAINSIIELKEANDYSLLLPQKLPKEFTSKEFEKIARVHAVDLHNSLMLLLQLGILTRDKRGGRSFIYSINNTTY